MVEAPGTGGDCPAASREICSVSFFFVRIEITSAMIGSTTVDNIVVMTIRKTIEMRIWSI